MATRRYSLTPEAQNEIVAFIRAGSFPHVAAEAAGIPAFVFRRWLALGNPDGRRRGWRPHPLYTPLWNAVRQATAQARVLAETNAMRDLTARWLMHGPGKEQPNASGWSQAVRPQPAPPTPETSFLMDPEVRAMLAALLHALEPFPEARAAAAAAMDDSGVPVPRRRGGEKGAGGPDAGPRP
jgi:hypothetical protein